VEADLDMRAATLPVPQACPAPRGCRGAAFQPVEGMSVITDYQEVRARRAPTQGRRR